MLAMESGLNPLGNYLQDGPLTDPSKLFFIPCVGPADEARVLLTSQGIRRDPFCVTTFNDWFPHLTRLNRNVVFPSPFPKFHLACSLHCARHQYEVFFFLSLSRPSEFSPHRQ